MVRRRSLSETDTLRGGIRAIRAMVFSMSLVRDRLLLLARRQDPDRRRRLVDDVDRFVGQAPVVDVTPGELGRGTQRVVRVRNAVVGLVVGLQAAQDLVGVVDARLLDLDLLEAPRQRVVALEVVAELVVGGRSDAADLPRAEDRLEQIGRIHRPATGRACADHGVDLVDEEDRVRLFLAGRR